MFGLGNNLILDVLPVKPENLRGALTDGSAGGAISWPVVFNLACTFFFGLALTLAIRSKKQTASLWLTDFQKFLNTQEKQWLK